MKKIVLLLLLVAVPAWAGNITKIGFRAYSSASQVECGVFGGFGLMPKDANGNVIQNFMPDDTYSRTLSLGTKGFANYSTPGRGNVAWTCRVKDTSSPVAVKVFLNGVETHFLTLDTGSFAIGR